ncbi:MAG: TetR/AcrR family transcriptional regulator [Halomonadaceae bacterium]|nr:MAG: TetR/AcrR family transcriptional regulator [Halomonadaceae bacterium]
MTRKPQQSRSRATVDAIIQAGFLVVAREGLEGTTTRHIADAAGISVGSLYEYFANKEAIYDAMYEHIVRDIVGTIRPLIPKLVTMGERDAVVELLYQFRQLLMRDQGRYLHYASYAMHLAQREHLEPLKRMLHDLLTQYAMHHPRVLKIQSIPAMGYIIINGGIFAVIRHLSEPAPVINFETLVKGLGDMVHYCIEGALEEAGSGTD